MTLLLPDQLDDFVNLTLKNFKRKKWADISLDYQSYIFADKMFSRKAKDPEKGGEQLNWKVQVTNTGTARHSEMFDVDVTGVKDLTKQAQIPWSKQTVNFSYDVDEDVMQSDRETIIREIAIRDHSMYNDYFELMEEALWSMPSSPTVSPRPPSGVPYWIVEDTSTTTPGFNGGNPSGHTAGAGGLSSTTYTNWANWAAAATDVSRDDFIEKAIQACEFTKFLAPKKYPELGGSGIESDFGFYTTYNLLQQLEKYLQSSNDNLGVDIAKYAGQVMLKGNGVTWVPYLQQNTTTDPFYGINWKVFRYFYRKGRHMLRQPPQKRSNQHTVRVVHMDNWGNFECVNRRRLFVVSFANGVS